MLAFSMDPEGPVDKVGFMSAAKGGDRTQKERSPLVQLEELRSQAASTGVESQPAQHSSDTEGSRSEVCLPAGQDLSSSDIIKMMREEDLQSR